VGVGASLRDGRNRAIRSPNRFKRPQRGPANRQNEEIRAPEVRLIGVDGEKLGIVPIEQALARAREQEMDLVEVAPDADPPVCRVLDYSKLQYERQRKQKEARKHHRHTDTKEVKLRPNIDEHDYQTKLRHLRDFLLKGHRGKITLMFKGYQMRRYEVGAELVRRMVKDVADIAASEPAPRTQSRTISVLLNPTKEVLAEAERHFQELFHRKEEPDLKHAPKQVGAEVDGAGTQQEPVSQSSPLEAAAPQGDPQGPAA